MRSDLKIFRLIPFVSFLLVATASLVAQSPSSNSTLSSNPAFQNNCAKCHGKTAEGRHFGGPSLVSEKTQSAPAEELRNIIANGRKRMPKYAGKLSGEEIDTLVRQIKAMNQK
jgi:mono/diheme cytochrome c family protein